MKGREECGHKTACVRLQMYSSLVKRLQDNCFSYNSELYKRLC